MDPLDLKKELQELLFHIESAEELFIPSKPLNLSASKHSDLNKYGLRHIPVKSSGESDGKSIEVVDFAIPDDEER